MQYRKFGKTNEMVSILGFGCMRLPMLPGAENNTYIDGEKAFEQVRYAIDNGVNYLDTAYTYHSTDVNTPGQSEPFVAKVLKDGYREKVKIATKLPSWLVNSREDMDRLLNHQLERLETDCIDFYLVHNIQAAVWGNLKNNGLNDFLDQALKDGRIKHAGFSFHDTPELFKEAVDYYDWSFCQIMYSYLDENFQAGAAGLDYAADKGMGIAIMEPLRGGMLATNLPQDAKAVFDRAGGDLSYAGWALKWIWNNPKVSVVLSGMNSMEQVKDNLKTAQVGEASSMSGAELKAVEDVKTIFMEKSKISCTQCRYCDCPVGVDIPTCFNLYNTYYLRDEDPMVKFNYGGMLKADHRRASACIECGNCEMHCPQQISIRDELKNVKALFEGA